MKTKASVWLKLPSEKHLETISKALEPEAKISTMSRSSVGLERKGKTLVLIFEAKDTAALRAAINSYLRWINSMMQVLKVIEKELAA